MNAFPVVRQETVLGLLPRMLPLLVAMFVALSVCRPLFSQVNQGNIQGGVFDQSGGAIAGATVTVIDVARGISRPLTSGPTGQYLAVNLIPGTYTVRASANGFQTVEHANVVVGVGQTIRVDFTLPPGTQTQSVTVSAPQVDTTDAVMGGEITNQAINELPLNGRNFMGLITLRPEQLQQLRAAMALQTAVLSTDALLSPIYF